MLCFHPRVVKVKKSVTWYKSVDSYVQVPCGKCVACRRRRQQDWSFRIQQESDRCKKAGGSVYFITLTLDDDHLTYLTDSDTGEVSQVPTLDSKLVGVFIRSFRKKYYRCYSYDDSWFDSHPGELSPLRYFACGEYGDHVTDNMRPHYHIIVFLKDNLRAEFIRPWVETSWNRGLVLGIHPLSTKLAEYAAKYSMKMFGNDYSDRISPFARMSLRPAIGSTFLNSDQCASYARNKSFVVYDFTGVHYSLPRYFRDRMYSKADIDARRVSLERQEQTLIELICRKDPTKLLDRYRANVRYEENLIKTLNLSTYVERKNV